MVCVTYQKITILAGLMLTAPAQGDINLDFNSASLMPENQQPDFSTSILINQWH